MANHREIRTFVESLSAADRKKFLESYGGGDDPFSTVLASFADPRKERIACEKVKALFGVEILTAAARQEQAARDLAAGLHQFATLAGHANITTIKTLRPAFEDKAMPHSSCF